MIQRVCREDDAKSECCDPEDDREGEPERRRPSERAEWANSEAHVPEHQLSREKDVVQRSTHFPFNTPFYFYFYLQNL